MVFTLSVLRKVSSIYQVALACGGIALAVLSLTLLLTSPLLALAPKNLLIGGLVIGVLLLFVAAIGTVGATQEKGGPALWAYVCLVSILLVMAVYGVASIGNALKESSLEKSLSTLWDTAPARTIVQIESWGQCCGFFNYTDRFQEPCTAYEEEIGCWEPMRSAVQGQLTAMMVPATVLLVGEALGLALTLLLAWALWRADRQAKLIGERQPFDAWHKAVFQ